ncbi:hypothetical protein Hypma_000999 [Hypsizygus marmoreus]|uniref:F-box domain-containing protein n=1 Tax=Hypsizygus marmoreus TaxID=39966 RepID=A0A369J608_HYPMA|nr:hypothetical protein Hypma_000999 [Hypsizygus marmoreus]
MAQVHPGLSYDLLVQVLEILRDDYATLYQCALVNSQLNQAASRFLYARVEYSPPYRPVLDLKDRGTLPESSMFASACNPRYAHLVIELKITGFLSVRPPPLNMLSDTIANAIRMFTNLSNVTLCPTTYHEHLFLASLEALQDCAHLCELAVNPSCMNDVTTPALSSLTGLRRLTLSSPGRTILNVLPDWLSRISRSLVGLHLEDNCGSITPGVLTSFVPHIQDNLQELTLGLSYSLADENVFFFLNQLPHLQRLQLQYYWAQQQLRPPTTHPRLSKLKYFAVDYSVIESRFEAINLCKWIRKVISSSPIEHIRLICDDFYKFPANVSFDSIVDHIVKKHSRTLLILDLGSAYIGVDSFRQLLSSCFKLEEMHVAVRKNALDIFEELSPRMEQLHTVSFDIRNCKRKKCRVEFERAAKMITQGPPSLRRLMINGDKWEVVQSLIVLTS